MAGLELVPWADSRRPTALTGIVGQDLAVRVLQALARSGQAPHVLLAGPSGCGKTTIARCVTAGTNVLTLAECDDRSIDAVRVRVKHFALLSSALPKSILVESFDRLTTLAQNAIRDVMDSAAVRFVLTTSSPDDVCASVAARCLAVRLKPVGKAELQKLLCAAGASPPLASRVAADAGGDVRSALNAAQAGGPLGDGDSDVAAAAETVRGGVDGVRRWVLRHTLT